MPFSFELRHVCTQTGARLGILHTDHGDFETPLFMPVGTQATVKTLEPSEIREVSEGLILGNTYHLWLQPGDDIVKDHGGIRSFMQWGGALLTDSGGFQVFSLSHIRKITEEGVTFRHHMSGEKLFMSPEDSIRIQNNLDADIIMSFDECPPFHAEYDYMKKSVERTIRWAKRGKDAHAKATTQALFGIVQGGPFEDLRKRSIDALVEIGFPGYSIGGLSVGESKTEMYRMLSFLKSHMPADKPRYLMGVGSPDDLVVGAMEGIDMFDCVLPTRLGRHGTAMTSVGKIVIKNKTYEKDLSPLDEHCDCKVCRTYTKSYLRHLLKGEEMLGQRLITYHNLSFLKSLMKDIRTAIANNRLGDFQKQFFLEYYGREAILEAK
jgi:queuine tRNA-ribosyltransferase